MIVAGESRSGLPLDLDLDTGPLWTVGQRDALYVELLRLLPLWAYRIDVRDLATRMIAAGVVAPPD